MLEQLQLKFTPILSTLKTADGGNLTVIGYIEIPVCYNSLTRNILFYLSPNLNQTLYLGINFWKSFNIAPQLFVSEINLNSETFKKNLENNIHCLSDIQL